MKVVHLLTIALVLLTSFYASAQDENISEVVQDSFYSAHPEAIDVIWDHQENLNRYVVRFYDGEIKKGAVYDSVGTCLEELTYLPRYALPHPISKQLENKYRSFNVGGILRIHRPDQPTFYKIRLVRDTSYQDVLFNAEGKVLERTSD